MTLAMPRPGGTSCRAPVPEVAKLISADTAAGRDLRQNSPFAGMLSEAERQRVLEKVR